MVKISLLRSKSFTLFRTDINTSVWISSPLAEFVEKLNFQMFGWISDRSVVKWIKNIKCQCVWQVAIHIYFVTSFFTTETSNPGVSPETWINSLQTRLLVWQISYLFKMPSFLHLLFFLVFSDLSFADHDMIWNSEQPCQLNWEPSCNYSDRCEDGKYCSTLFKQVNQHLVHEQDRWVYVVFGGCILYKNT